MSAMQDSGTNQSVLARAIGVDRSTISQLLTDEGARLPNAHVVGACASALGVSADWLLSLSDRRESAAELLAGSLSMTEAPRALVDERIFAWHQEAAGYKIRHVPASLPDMLKTRALLEWEYKPHLGRTADQAIGASEDRLQWMRSAGSDYEICIPIYELHCFAEGIGYYHGLPADVRREHQDRAEGNREQRHEQRAGRDEAPRRRPFDPVRGQRTARFEKRQFGLHRLLGIVDEIANDIFERYRRRRAGRPVGRIAMADAAEAVRIGRRCRGRWRGRFLCGQGAISRCSTRP